MELALPPTSETTPDNISTIDELHSAAIGQSDPSNFKSHLRISSCKTLTGNPSSSSMTGSATWPVTGSYE